MPTMRRGGGTRLGGVGRLLLGQRHAHRAIVRSGEPATHGSAPRAACQDARVSEATACWCWPGRRSATRPTRRPGWRPSWPAPTSSPPRTPVGCAGWCRPSASRLGGRVVSYYEHNEAARTAGAGRGAARRGPGAARHRRRDAVGVRPRLPAGRRRRRRRRPGHRGARAERRADRAGASPGCRSTGSASRGSCRARPGERAARLAAGRRRPADAGVLRGAAPARGDADRDGRWPSVPTARRPSAAS